MIDFPLIGLHFIQWIGLPAAFIGFAAHEILHSRFASIGHTVYCLPCNLEAFRKRPDGASSCLSQGQTHQQWVEEDSEGTDCRAAEAVAALHCSIGVASQGMGLKALLLDRSGSTSCSG